jgi:hypothetical protein
MGQPLCPGRPWIPLEKTAALEMRFCQRGIASACMINNFRLYQGWKKTYGNVF